MIPLELDHREDTVDGLYLWVTTNVRDSGAITLADLHNLAESQCPELWTLEFEVGPEDMFAAAV